MRQTMLAKFAMLAGAGMIFCAASIAGAQTAPAAPPAVPANLLEKVNGTRHFTEVSVLIGSSKFWLPSTIVVDQGDKVEITLRNEVPGAGNQHGFAIPGYNIEKVVTAGKPEKVEFTADKAGLFTFGCQLHPGHVGGQLIVRPKG